MNRWLGFVLAAGAVTFSAANFARAQEITDTQYVPGSEAAKDSPTGLPDGLHPVLTLGANLNLAQNSNWVGQVDGLSVLVGASIIGQLRYISGANDWKNTLLLNETWAKTPIIDEFLKSNDVLDIESLYRYFAWKWGGPFARLSLQTSIFPAEQVTADPQTYVLEGEDPADGQTTDRFDLADPFQPLTLTESVGLFAAPVTGPHLNLGFRAGFGGRHTFADGVNLITNDDDPMAVTYIELADVHQAGLELFAGLDGKAVQDRLSYNAGVAVLVPFINNDDTDRDALELTRIAFQAGLTTNVFTWMALSYQLRVVDDPQLLDKVQVQNSLLLTFSYTFPPPEPPKEADGDAVAAAEERARLAEERAKLAEERARLAEERANAATQPAPAPAPPPAPAQAPPSLAPAPAPTPAPGPAPAPPP
jgi:hypothetical protein